MSNNVRPAPRRRSRGPAFLEDLVGSLEGLPAGVFLAGGTAAGPGVALPSERQCEGVRGTRRAPAGCPRCGPAGRERNGSQPVLCATRLRRSAHSSLASGSPRIRGCAAQAVPRLPETTEWTGSARPVAGARPIFERRGEPSGVRLYGEGWRGTRRGSPACGVLGAFSQSSYSCLAAVWRARDPATRRIAGEEFNFLPPASCLTSRFSSFCFLL